MYELAELFNKSLGAYEKKDYKQAERIVDEILKKDSQYEKAIFLKAVIFDETGRNDKAKKYFEQLTNLSLLWLRLGMQIEQFDIERAIICYDKALAINPNDNYALYLKGLLIEKNGDLVEASRCFKALKPKREFLTKVIIPFGFMCLLSIGAFMLISRGEQGLSFVVFLSAFFCLFWLKRDGSEIIKMIYKKLSVK